jgi:hypothetical protein
MPIAFQVISFVLNEYEDAAPMGVVPLAAIGK